MGLCVLVNKVWGFWLVAAGLAVVLGCGERIAWGQMDGGDGETGSVGAVQTGAYTASFDDRHGLSSIASMKARMRYAVTERAPEYELIDESYFVWVPEGFDPGKRYGLFVWVSPTESGAPRPDWLAVLEKHDLIWIGANHAGNPRLGWHRFGLALDAVHNMTLRYPIDPDRVYISGMSGGGRVASRMGVVWADVFAGAFPMVGCDFYKRTPAAGQPGKYYQERYEAPTGRLMAKAREESRFVLLTGENDFNRDETKVIFEEGFESEGFSHVSYLEVPGMAHVLPGAAWFEKGIELLDGPLVEIRRAAVEKLAEREAQARAAFDDAMEKFAVDPTAGYESLRAVAARFEGTEAGRQAGEKADAFAADPANAERLAEARLRSEAAQLLLLADSYVKAGRRDLAREKLLRVIEMLPGSDLAEQAQSRLEEL